MIFKKIIVPAKINGPTIIIESTVDKHFPTKYMYRQSSSGCACSSDCAPGISAAIGTRENFIGKKKHTYTWMISYV